MKLTEAAYIVEAAILNNLSLAGKNARDPQFIIPYLEGKPGLGKTTLVVDICKKLGVGCKIVSLSQYDPAEIAGWLIPNADHSAMIRLRPDWMPVDGNGVVYLDELPQAQIDQLLQEYRLNGLDALLSEIGLGNRPVQEIVRKLLPGVSGTLQLGMVDSGTNALIIGEKGGMLLNYARCCYPIPGDAVVGQLSSGRGITIHQETCRHVEPILGDSLHCLAVQWQSGIEGEFVAGLRVEMKNKRGMLASVASAIADSDSNIERVTTADRHGDISMLVIEVSVRDRVHLARVIRKIKAIDAVSRVFRSRS